MHNMHFFKVSQLAQIHHEESAKIVNQAIAAIGEGKKGLAERLNKDPSLISRYASGMVRPKAETLLMCMEFIRKERAMEWQLDRNDKIYSVVKESVLGLSSSKDTDLIYALYNVLKVAQKV